MGREVLDHNARVPRQPSLDCFGLAGDAVAIPYHRPRSRHAVVRYADDFVVFCESREDALRVKDTLLPSWLAERGLTLSEEKTRVVHLTEGFDFLGCTVRHYRAPRTSRTGYK
jgi:hypothetical protein